MRLPGRSLRKEALQDKQTQSPLARSIFPSPTTPVPPMFSEQIELRGHIIDSLILPKVLDEILTYGGTFTIREVKIGRQRHDPSYACIDVFGPSPEVVDDIVRRLRQHGAEVVEQRQAQLVPAPANGVFPTDFYVTTNQQTFVHFG